jgi:acetyl-CoA C-acetyltransferase
MKHSSQWNLTRESLLGQRARPETPGLDLQRACGTSLEAAILGQQDCAGPDRLRDRRRRRHGQRSAGGIPEELPALLLRSYRGKSAMARMRPGSASGRGISSRYCPAPRNRAPACRWARAPNSWSSAGASSRTDQDQLALESHKKAAAAYAAASTLIWCIRVSRPRPGQQHPRRYDAREAGQAAARIRFLGRGHADGGQFDADDRRRGGGAAGSEEWARQRNLPVLAYLTLRQGRRGRLRRKKEGLLMAPAYAVPRMLADAQPALQDFDFYEIHEAFAGQVLCTLAAWTDEAFCRDKLGLCRAAGTIDRSKLNVKGGSIAIGHPFAATGARIVATLAKTLDEARPNAA